MAELQVRALDTRDFFKIMDILRKGGKEAFQKMQNAAQQDGETSENYRTMILLDVGMEHAQKELKELFASLAGISVEEYEKSDFDTTLTIIEHIEEHNNMASFFKRVTKLVQKYTDKGKAKPPEAQ